MHLPFNDAIRGIVSSILVVLFIISLYLFEREINKLKKQHKEELSVVKCDAFDHGWNEARLSLPIVQHCNRKTNYEFIHHRWDPGSCKLCLEIKELLES